MKKLKDKFFNFYKTPYGLLITVSWVVLIICLIIKLFGGNWFELGSENSRFNQFCLFVDNHTWLKIMLGCIIAIIITYPVYCVMLNEKFLTLKHTLILIPLIIIKCVISWYSSIVSVIIDVFVLLVLMTLLNKNFKRNILCFIIVLALF